MRQSGFSIVEACIALALVAILAVSSASILNLFAQNRSGAARSRDFTDVQNGMGRTFSTRQSCVDAITAASGSWPALSTSPATLTMSKISVGVMASPSASASVSPQDLYVAGQTLASDPTTYIKSIYLTNGVADVDNTWFYQAYVELLHPAPPKMANGTYDLTKVTQSFRPLLLGTVHLAQSGGAVTCYPVTGTSACSPNRNQYSADATDPADQKCPAKTAAVGFDPNTNTTLCAPQLTGCYYNPAGHAIETQEPYPVTGACSARPTAPPAGFAACSGGAGFQEPPHNCVLDSTGAWKCSVWCRRVNCEDL